MQSRHRFEIKQPVYRSVTWGDALVFVGIALLLYVGARLAFNAPAVIQGPEISLSAEALPWYAILSVRRMAIAYVLSLLFALVYGRVALRSKRAERILLPILDILQSIPILSFLPVVLLSLSAILPQTVAVELASIILIFTSQVWNLVFSWYQSLVTIPKELREASTTFRLNGWMRFKTLELPFASVGLIWNSIMSWAGGWFFLMAAEIFTVGKRDFRLPGLGAYLQQAASQGDLKAVAWGIGTLVLVIVLFDQFLWRPLLAWADRFKLETVESENPPTSWFYDLLRNSRVASWFLNRVWRPANERLDQALLRRFPPTEALSQPDTSRPWVTYILTGFMVVALTYGTYQAGAMLISVPLDQWASIGIGLIATLLHVLAALVIALAWTIIVGVLIGTNQRVATILQPLVQILASVPATALFPVVLLFLLPLPGGLDIAAVLLMLMGTQWYLLFNVIAGATAIPQDMKYTATLLHLSRRERWRTLILPALFPYIITGAITASGGAWNASIVAERVEFRGETLSTTGIGATIAQATSAGNYPLLLAATLSMMLTVVLINRFVWRRLYRLAEEKYRME